MVLDIVSNYKVLLAHLSNLIEVSGYRQDYLSKKMGMKTATFSAKKLKGNWSPDEVEQLLSIISNEDVEDYLLLRLMENSESEETISYEEFKSQMGI